MKGTLIGVRGTRASIPPKLTFNIEVENESRDTAVWVFAWSGEVGLEDPRWDLGNLKTEFKGMRFAPLEKQSFGFEWEIDYAKLERLEEERKGGNLLLNVVLNLLQASLPEAAAMPISLHMLRSAVVRVYSPGHGRVFIAKSVWEEQLERLGYGKVEYLELYLPPPPMGTQLDIALGHLKKAKENFSKCEDPDVLTSCRRAIEELQKLFGSNEDERKIFVAQTLQDEKKAEDYRDLLEVVQKAKNFASGGPHTYWVRAADRRDAELALRITWAIVGYFAKNLARLRT